MTKRDISSSNGDHKPVKSWRNVLKVHPAALEYPRLSEAELVELGEDIAARGLEVNIVLIREGDEDLLLDGIGRLTAIEANGVNLDKDGKLDHTLGLGGGSRVRIVAGVDPYALAGSLNAHRRHLTPEQKRARIEALIKQSPEKSDRQIAGTLKASPTTVSKARKKLEASGDVSKVDTSIDTAGRRQPRKRSKAEKKIQFKPLRDRPRPPPREYELRIVHEPTRMWNPSEPAQFVPKPTAVAPAQNTVLESELEEMRKSISVAEGKGHSCTFCGKSQPDVFVLISAPANTAFICDECIDLGANLVRERKAKAADAKLPLNPAEAAAKELATTP
jgi:hypothetical protein